MVECLGQPPSCEQEVDLIINRMEQVRNRIKENGGAHRLSFVGENCNECEATVVDEFPITEFFEYVGKTNEGFIGAFGVAVGAHCWGEIRSRRNGRAIGTVDFWEDGEDEYWRAGRDSFGWIESDKYSFVESMGESGGSGAPPWGYLYVPGSGD
jgi:hypothetical protein